MSSLITQENHDHWNRNFSWNIHLASINEFKKEIFVSPEISPSDRKRILERPLPRFFWRCIIEKKQKKMVEFLFDATDVFSGDLFMCHVEYDEEFSQQLLNRLESLKNSTIPQYSKLKQMFRVLFAEETKK